MHGNKRGEREQCVHVVYVGIDIKFKVFNGVNIRFNIMFMFDLVNLIQLLMYLNKEVRVMLGVNNLKLSIL